MSPDDSKNPRGKRSDDAYKTRAYLLHRSVIKQLDALSVATGRDRSDLVNEALREYLTQHREKLAELLDELSDFRVSPDAKK